MFKGNKLLPVLCFALLMVISTVMFTGCQQQEEETADTSLQRIQDAGEITFSMSGGYPPFNYYNNQNELVGFDIDVCNEVASRLGVDFRPVPNEWSGIIEGLRSGVYDGILGSMAITDKREEVVDFSIPYYYSGAQIMVQADSDIQSIDELAGKAVGLVTGTTFESDANSLNAEIKLYKDDNQTLMELNNGNLDAVITDRVVGVNAINSGNFDLKLLGNPMRTEDIAVAFRDEDDALREAVNEVLQEMHNDGTLTELSKKWLNVDITQK